MTTQQSHVSSDETQAFSLSVGKAIQHCGTIELLLNQLIESLVADSLLTASLIRSNIPTRLQLLASLIERHKEPLARQGWETGELFKIAKDAFVMRNKIAHNPFAFNEQSDGEQVQITTGILVVRYRKAGSTEEWVDEMKLKDFIVTSRDLLLRFKELLDCCKNL